eukprot:TRINITY_DN5073_c0_g1_i2.p1 TRINITY_DN5073_c0_g1~~TRINITY_DN5073_c0_g1_i2.p1  ORF type:complete len:101 (+),score=9.84 TRINITY_DN5073_c0_g1_i2:1185-1487(+)
MVTKVGSSLENKARNEVIKYIYMCVCVCVCVCVCEAHIGDLNNNHCRYFISLFLSQSLCRHCNLHLPDSCYHVFSSLVMAGLRGNLEWLPLMPVSFFFSF